MSSSAFAVSSPRRRSYEAGRQPNKMTSKSHESVHRSNSKSRVNEPPNQRLRYPGTGYESSGSYEGPSANQIRESSRNIPYASVTTSQNYQGIDFNGISKFELNFNDILTC